MKKMDLLTTMSLLSVILLSFHLTDDILHSGPNQTWVAQGGAVNLVAVPVLALWLFGALVLRERRSGYVILLLGSLFALAMPILHMTGPRFVGGEIAKPSGAFFFVWTLIALGVTGMVSAVLSIRALWSLRANKGESAGPVR
ncbi:MAG TPA: hypothetical protein VGM86_33480 [Thermoanaerobaculia bacterium]|jgi:hypothetical protein